MGHGGPLFDNSSAVKKLFLAACNLENGKL
jgi:hypothetical protein